MLTAFTSPPQPQSHINQFYVSLLGAGGAQSRQKKKHTQEHKINNSFVVVIGGLSIVHACTYLSAVSPFSADISVTTCIYCDIHDTCIVCQQFHPSVQILVLQLAYTLTYMIHVLFVNSFTPQCRY